MPETAKCPMCAEGMLTRSEGRLDQSGNTYLPTVVWTCDTCGCVKFEPATVVHWRAIPVARPLAA